MIRSAVTARLPLIAAYTTDTINVNRVLDAATGQTFYEVRNSPLMTEGNGVIKPSGFYFHIGDPEKDYRELYLSLVTGGSVLVIVNPERPDPLLFDTGVLHTPLALRETILDSVYSGPDMHSIGVALQGLTVKEVVEVLHMAVVLHKSITLETVRETRRQIIKPAPGVRAIHATGTPYIPDPKLVEWYHTEGVLLKQTQYPTLQPRGVLLQGPPGTGKTEASRWLAEQLQVPLYLLDVGAIASKYYGESEKNLTLALRQIEQVAPCVVLLDEVEKLFQVSEESGTTSRLLSSLLWWLQERTANVLAVMTTNDCGSIPPELYRAGRIDAALTFSLLPAEVAQKFAAQIAKEYSEQLGIRVPDWHQFLEWDFSEEVSPAEVVSTVLRKFKSMVIQTIKEGSV